MHISEKLDKVADKLLMIVENLQQLRQKEDAYQGQIQELLGIALHYCNIIMVTKELSETTNLEPYKKDIMNQLTFIEDFILLTEDLTFA